MSITATDRPDGHKYIDTNHNIPEETPVDALAPPTAILDESGSSTYEEALEGSLRWEASSSSSIASSSRNRLDDEDELQIDDDDEDVAEEDWDLAHGGDFLKASCG